MSPTKHKLNSSKIVSRAVLEGRATGATAGGPFHRGAHEYMSIYIVFIIYIWNTEMEFYMFIHLA